MPCVPSSLLTPTRPGPPHIPQDIDQTVFGDFSFVAPHILEADDAKKGLKRKASKRSKKAAAEPVFKLADYDWYADECVRHHARPCCRSSPRVVSHHTVSLCYRYRPEMDRKQAEESLKKEKRGAFYIRESSSRPGCYGISVALGNNQASHGLIRPLIAKDGKTMYKLVRDELFPTIVQLVMHYQTKGGVPTPEGGTLKLLK